MANKDMKSVEEKRLLSNALRTSMYLVDALTEDDFDSAKIELEELKYLMAQLEEKKIKRERMETLITLIMEMKKRGISIDFANREPFFEKTANIVVESNINNKENTEKRQQALC